jgi:hypothetical protein
MQLKCFLDQRFAELKSDLESSSNIITLTSSTSNSKLSNDPLTQQKLKIVQQNNNVHALTKMSTHIQSIIDILEGKKFKTLIEIKHSKRYPLSLLFCKHSDILFSTSNFIHKSIPTSAWIVLTNVTLRIEQMDKIVSFLNWLFSISTANDIHVSVVFSCRITFVQIRYCQKA